LNLIMQPVEVAEKQPFFNLPETTFQPIVTVAEPSTSLWKLADSLSKELDVSIYQAMFGIYLYNSDAFINMDMNMMRADKSLAIPDKQYMKLLSPKISEDIVKTFTS
ncbi:MAG: FimV/HubP family polar landmark protein, partial [Gammaproteobacteria bacterium]